MVPGLEAEELGAEAARVDGEGALRGGAVGERGREEGVEGLGGRDGGISWLLLLLLLFFFRLSELISTSERKVFTHAHVDDDTTCLLFHTIGEIIIHMYAMAASHSLPMRTHALAQPTSIVHFSIF